MFIYTLSGVAHFEFIFRSKYFANCCPTDFFWKINDLISPVRSKVTIFGHLRAVRLKEVLLSNVAVITYRDVRVLTSLNRWKDCTFLTRPLECEKILLCLKFMQSDRFFHEFERKEKRSFCGKRRGLERILPWKLSRQIAHPS